MMVAPVSAAVVLTYYAESILAVLKAGKAGRVAYLRCPAL